MKIEPSDFREVVLHLASQTVLYSIGFKEEMIFLPLKGEIFDGLEKYKKISAIWKARLCFLMFILTEVRTTACSGRGTALGCPAMLVDTLQPALLAERPPLTCSIS